MMWHDDITEVRCISSELKERIGGRKGEGLGGG